MLCRKHLKMFAIIDMNAEGIFVSSKTVGFKYIVAANKRSWDRKNDFDGVIRVIK